MTLHKIIVIQFLVTASLGSQLANMEQDFNEGSWYLVTVRSKKRNVFLKFLRLAIAQNKLDDFIEAVEIPEDGVYEDLVLLNLSNFKAVSTHLQKVENFQSIQRKPLTSEQVHRMLGLK